MEFKKCVVCGKKFRPRTYNQTRCKEHIGLFKKECRHCGKSFITKHEGIVFCPSPAMCRYLHNLKSDGSVTVVGISAKSVKKPKYILSCVKCGNMFEGTKNPAMPNGFSVKCRICHPHKNKGMASTAKGGRKREGNAEWWALSDKPRKANIEALKKLPSIERDESFKIKACMNCGRFETIYCFLPEEKMWLKSFDIASYSCEAFRWWGDLDGS